MRLAPAPNGRAALGDFQADIRLGLVPTPRIEFHLRDIDVASPLFDPNIRSVVVTPPDTDFLVSGWSSRIGETGSDTEYRLVPAQTPVTLFESDDRLSSATFLLYDFKDFTCPSTVRRGNMRTSAVPHFVVGWNGWDTEIVAVDAPSRQGEDRVRARLEREGGYAVTHAGRIRKTDAASFTVDELRAFATPLGWLLTFANGAWCHPVLLQGIGCEGDIVWHELSEPSDPWEGSPSSWFEYDADLIVQLAPLFFDLWHRSKEWARTLREAIFFYSLANRSGVRGSAGIVLAQAALERLVSQWETDQCRRSSDSFAKRLTKFCQDMRLPESVPDTIRTRKTYRHSSNRRLTAATVVTKVRNNITHARPDPDPSGFDHGEVWALTMWYLELAILRLCGYRGRYWNRLEPGWRGELKAVPWS